MGRFDILAGYDLTVLHEKQAYTSTESIQGTDVADYHGAGFIVDAGAWTDGTFTLKFQHRDGTDSWADIPDSDLDGSEPVIDGDADDAQQYKIGYTGTKEQIGAVITVTGSPSTGAILGVYCLKGRKSQYG